MKGVHGARAIRSIDDGAGSWNDLMASSVRTRASSVSSTSWSAGSPPADWPMSMDPRQGWNLTPSCLAASISASSRSFPPLGKT